MIKAVLIDIDNTLLDFNKSSALAIEKSFNEHGLTYSDTVYSTFLSINAELWRRIERGEFTRAQLHAERWNIILNALGVEFDGTLIERSFLDNLYDCAIVIDGALEIVKYLSKKYYLCSASNAPHDQQLHRLEVSGIKPFIKCAFTSESLKADKPSKEFFDRCFEKLNGVTPQETIIIGDSLTADINGGANYGMKTLWYNHNKEVEPKEKTYDYVVNRLIDIKNIL
ncbi:MAG: YjjG family noncanonical pyrimidine nucleotidase [Clostridia bacterium]|nr:YjjG family noncanonical pyrimidine nucleotidase [Clostridia bacterium]